jgi:hypothetical protein
MSGALRSARQTERGRVGVCQPKLGRYFALPGNPSWGKQQYRELDAPLSVKDRQRPLNAFFTGKRQRVPC